MQLDSKHTEASFSPKSTDLLHLQFAQVPRSPDLATFVSRQPQQWWQQNWLLYPSHVHGNHGITSTLHTVKCLAPILQCPGLGTATNLKTIEMPLSSLFMLDHTHCHPPTWAWLSSNHMQRPKLLNNTKYCTETTSLHAQSFSLRCTIENDLT